VRILITKPWCRTEFPFATAIVGKVYDVSTSIAMYLFALGAAERVNDSLPEPSHRHSTRWRLIREGSMAEARVRIAGRWHQLRLEVDEAILRQCGFYREGHNGSWAY
jgi:hypothetical protein